MLADLEAAVSGSAARYAASCSITPSGSAQSFRVDAGGEISRIPFARTYMAV